MYSINYSNTSSNFDLSFAWGSIHIFHLVCRDAEVPLRYNMGTGHLFPGFHQHSKLHELHLWESREPTSFEGLVQILSMLKIMPIIFHLSSLVPSFFKEGLEIKLWWGNSGNIKGTSTLQWKAHSTDSQRVGQLTRACKAWTVGLKLWIFGLKLEFRGSETSPGGRVSHCGQHHSPACYSGPQPGSHLWLWPL